MLKRDIVTHRSYIKRTTIFAAVQAWFPGQLVVSIRLIISDVVGCVPPVNTPPDENLDFTSGVAVNFTINF